MKLWKQFKAWLAAQRAESVVNLIAWHRKQWWEHVMLGNWKEADYHARKTHTLKKSLK